MMMDGDTAQGGTLCSNRRRRWGCGESRDEARWAVSDPGEEKWQEDTGGQRGDGEVGESTGQSAGCRGSAAKAESQTRDLGVALQGLKLKVQKMGNAPEGCVEGETVVTTYPEDLEGARAKLCEEISFMSTILWLRNCPNCYPFHRPTNSLRGGQGAWTKNLGVWVPGSERSRVGRGPGPSSQVLNPRTGQF